MKIAVASKRASLGSYVFEPPTPDVERYGPQRTKFTKKNVYQRTTRWKRSHALRVVMQIHQRWQRWEGVRITHENGWFSILLVLWILCMIGSFAGTMYGCAYYQRQLSKLQGLAHQAISQTTRMYDRNLTPLFEVYDNRQGGGRRTPVSFDEIPQVMRDALIAAEDHSFWTNAGIDPQGILRSGLKLLEHMCNGNFKCIPGIAQLDFNQQTKQHEPLLGLARASLLAGMPQKPVTDNPTIDQEHKQRALARQRAILNQMIALHMSVAGLGRITPSICSSYVA